MKALPFVLLGLALATQPPVDPLLTIERIDPESGKQGRTVGLLVYGQAFEAPLDIDLGESIVFGEPTIAGDGSFLAVEATISGEAQPGPRTLTISSANGESVSLENAFTVLEDGPAVGDRVEVQYYGVTSYPGPRDKAARTAVPTLLIMRHLGYFVGRNDDRVVVARESGTHNGEPAWFGMSVIPSCQVVDIKVLN